MSKCLTCNGTGLPPKVQPNGVFVCWMCHGTGIRVTTRRGVEKLVAILKQEFAEFQERHIQVEKERDELRDERNCYKVALERLIEADDLGYLGFNDPRREAVFVLARRALSK